MGVTNFDTVQANAYLGIGYGVPSTTGNTWYVSSVTGNNSNDGKSPARPKGSIAGAISAATASRNDVIVLMPGHTSTISSATGLALNKAGITIVGIGNGNNRPVLTLDTATTATIAVSAANITIQNVVFVANFADVASCFTLTTAKDFTVKNCEFRDTSSVLNFVSIITTGSTNNAADGLSFVGNTVNGLGTTAATTPIKIAGNCDRVTINDNFIVLAILNNTSAVLAHTSKVVTSLLMARNRVFRPNTDTATGGILITTSSTTNTGIVCDNYVQHADVAAAILVTAGSIYGMFNNLADGDADASGYVLPAIGAN